MNDKKNIHDKFRRAISPERAAKVSAFLIAWLELFVMAMSFYTFLAWGLPDWPAARFIILASFWVTWMLSGREKKK